MAYTQKQFLLAIGRAGIMASAVIALAFFTVQAMDREAVYDCQKLAKVHQGQSLVDECLRK